MADAQISWDDLARYKAERRFLDGYPADFRTFFAPRDDIHGLLTALLGSAQHSIVVNMFGYDDDELNNIIQSKLADEHIYVQMSLDRSQATVEHERKILTRWNNDAFGNSIAIGTSSVHNAISHLKVVIVDASTRSRDRRTGRCPVRSSRTTSSAATPSSPPRPDRCWTSTTTSCSSRWREPSSTSASSWPGGRRRRPPVRS